MMTDKDLGRPPSAARMPTPAYEEITPVTFPVLLSALSAALDLTEGQPMGHAVRACLIALRIAEALGLPRADQADLYLAALLKDSGCSSNAARMYAIFGCDDITAKGDSKRRDWRRITEGVRFAFTHTLPQASFTERMNKLREILNLPGRVMDVLTEARCTRGADIARSLELSETVAAAIYHLDEHWDGQGAPHGVAGDSIPILSRILCLAQTLEVFAATSGVRCAYAVARQRSGRWFDPVCVRAAESFAGDSGFWSSLGVDSSHHLAHASEALLFDRVFEGGVDSICVAFAGIVDAKSTFTAAHSSRVARVAIRLARRLDIDHAGRRRLYRAALLHDLGKLAVPNVILDKPGVLTASEFGVVQRHPFHTEAILRQIPGFARLTAVAAAHHEKLDGSGYHRGLTADNLDIEMRILAVADTYDALASDRPYRPALDPAQIREILHRDSGNRLDRDCIEALQL